MATMQPKKIQTLFLVLVCILFQEARTAEASSFKVKRAINIATWFTWPRYEAAPKTGIEWPPYSEQFKLPARAELAALEKAGFDTVRLPVDPAPFFLFVGARKEFVFNRLEQAISLIQSIGLKVIVDVHPNSRHKTWGQYAVVAGLETPAFNAYAKTIAEFAIRLEPFGTNKIALELINEPRLECKDSEVHKLVAINKRLIQLVRKKSPDMTLVVSGGCASSIEGLLSVNPTAFQDDNLIYTFHFYEPFAFTHQGATFIPWTEKYLGAVAWPGHPQNAERTLKQSEEMVAADKSLGIVERATTHANVAVAIMQYYSAYHNRDSITRRLGLVAGWAEKHHILSSSIFLGEFGAIKTAPCSDRITWVRDVRKTAEDYGFSWAIFNLQGPFSIFDDPQTRNLDSGLLAALGMTAGNATTFASACK
ncbi:MAG: glycoside hydrolase family 5 protein [Rhizobiaceae bacterium]